MKLGLGLSLPKYRLSSFLDAATQAVFDYASTQGYTVASAETQLLLDNAITSLKSDGIWSVIDILYFLITDGDRDFAKINIKNPGTFNCLENGTLTFTSKQGFNTNGTTGYLDTQFIAATHAVNYTQNSASVFSWNYSFDTTQSSTSIGVRGSGNTFSQVNPVFTSGSCGGRINHTSGQITAANVSTGLQILNRANSSTVKIFKNGSEIQTASIASSTVPATHPFSILALNNVGSQLISHSSLKVSIAGIGGSLEANQSDLYNIFNAYVSNI